MVSDESKNHILIAHKGSFFTFPVLQEDGSIKRPEEMYTFIKHILDTNTTENEFALGALTAENRDVWAEVRSRLVELGNEEALNSIDSALYCLALDDVEEVDENKLSRGYLYGNAYNRLVDYELILKFLIFINFKLLSFIIFKRWFDKNYTVIVNKNGFSGYNFEHS